MVREGVRPVPVATLVDDTTRKWLLDARRVTLKTDTELLLTPTELPTTPYADPRLKIRAEMVALVRRLAAMDFHVFVTRCRSHVGVFTVEKKGGQLRFLFDCRSTNAGFRDAPSTDLTTLGALSGMGLSDFSPQPEFERSFGSVVLRDSLYQVGWRSLADSFCLDIEGSCEEFGAT